MSANSVLLSALTTRVGELLHYEWDPIGISGIPQARDEYDSYVPQVVAMLIAGTNSDAISKYLYEVEGARMGLTVGSRPSDQIEAVAEMLIDHYEVLKERAE